MKQNDPKLIMLEHSEAKVNLYGTYLSIYLNILSRVPTVDKIFIFDLFCGEGIYEGGGKGSPMIALDAIKNHYYSNNNTSPNITVWFNDNGESEMEPGISKVDRVQRLCKSLFVPTNVSLEFKIGDYDTILPQALNILRTTQRSKGLFFLDPYGYKDIKLTDIRKILNKSPVAGFLSLGTVVFITFT
jgi:three-Cys-motif partner protein